MNELLMWFSHSAVESFHITATLLKALGSNLKTRSLDATPIVLWPGRQKVRPEHLGFLSL